MTSQPDQNQPTPPPFNVPPDQDRANPANWVSEPKAVKKAEEPKAAAKKTASSK